MRHHRYFFVQPHNLQISGLRQLEYFITSLVKLSPFLSTHDGSDTCQHLPNNNRCRRRRIRHVDSVETCCGWAEEGRGPEAETSLPAFFAPLTSTPLPSSSRSYRARIRNFALSLSPLSRTHSLLILLSVYRLCKLRLRRRSLLLWLWLLHGRPRPIAVPVPGGAARAPPPSLVPWRQMLQTICSTTTPLSKAPPHGTSIDVFKMWIREDTIHGVGDALNQLLC